MLPEARYHPCWSGLQVQGTAISPAAWKLYDLVGCSTQNMRMICIVCNRLLSITCGRGFVKGRELPGFLSHRIPWPPITFHRDTGIPTGL
ncbi:hypothetical protein CBFG_05987 [Clostridiales bacterium 1_7_47FAA]|nr:hypothetical protein CBFG_05987 [Clostridiales bacterium 1_7_47FAA]